MKIENGTTVQIEKNKREMERALEKLLQERVEIRKKIINLGGCYKKEDCENKLYWIAKDEIIGDILYRIFDIQDHEFLDIQNDYCIDVVIK